jgi:hypothetical protein
MILVGSGPQDGPTWHQNRIQHRSKFDPKGHRNQDAIWVGIWSPLGTIVLDPTLQVGAKIGKIGVSRRCQKMTEKVECDTTRQKYADGGFPTNPLRVLFS